jgi:hypothetical protein
MCGINPGQFRLRAEIIRRGNNSGPGKHFVDFSPYFRLPSLAALVVGFEVTNIGAGNFKLPTSTVLLLPLLANAPI